MSVQANSVTRNGGFSEEALRELSWSKGEPEWLREMRLAAWRSYDQMPMPSRKEEEWRRTDISLLDLGSVTPFAEPTPAVVGVEELPADLRAVLGGNEERGGLLVHRNSSGSYRYLAPELAERGVIFSDLDTALRDHPELVRKHLGAVVRPDEGKFTALHYAFWSGGAFVYVPRNVEVQLPLQSMTWADRNGLAVMPHTLVVLEEGASLLFVDELASTEADGPTLSNGVIELSMAQASQLQYVSLQRWGRSTYHFATQRATVGRDVAFKSASVVLGSRVAKSWIGSTLSEPGANVVMSGIMFADGNQRFHHHTLQDHQAPNTTSDLLFKAALTDHSRSEYSGLIRVHKDAQKTDAYQANRNLSLSEHARADSMPKLEIEANDVRCTHGATVGPIESEQLFYLMSRGLPRRSAERMIVQGFLEPVMDKIPLETVRERVREVVDAKLEEG